MNLEAWVPTAQPWQDCQKVQERPGAGEPLSGHQSRACRKEQAAAARTPQMTPQRGKPHPPTKYEASAEVKA